MWSRVFWYKFTGISEEMLPPYSGPKNKSNSQAVNQRADEDSILLQNVGILLPDNTVLYPRR
jgi:hypothetical protein